VCRRRCCRSTGEVEQQLVSYLDRHPRLLGEAVKERSP
jgi:hypothetical protein